MNSPAFRNVAIVAHVDHGKTTLVEGEPQPLDHHDQLRWIAPGSFDEVDWLESDREAVDTLAKGDT